MLHHYFQQKNLNPFSESLEVPIKELMDLNVKALQNLSYLTPTDLLRLRKPEEVMEKNLQIFINNSHTALAYMHNMFDIMEKHWLKNGDNSTQSSKVTGSDTRSFSNIARSNASKASITKKPTMKTAKSGTSSTKSSIMKGKNSITKTSSTKKQPVKHEAVTKGHESHSASKLHTVNTPEVKHISTDSTHSTTNASGKLNG